MGEEFHDGRSRFDFRPEAVEASVARSLARLRTDRLDIVLIHSDGRDRRILDELGTLDCLKDLRDRGLIRAVGISHKTVDGARRAMELGCDVIMATLNTEDTSELPAIREAAIQGCGVLIKKALASGHAGPASLRMAAREPAVSSVVVGTIDPHHLQEKRGPDCECRGQAGTFGSIGALNPIDDGAGGAVVYPGQHSHLSAVGPDLVRTHPRLPAGSRHP